jgi:hypothetical protein
MTFAPFTHAADSPNVAPLLDRLKSVGKEGAGTKDAAVAYRELVKSDAQAIPAVLAALDNASPEAANWLRSAVDAIAEKSLTSGKPLPARELESYVLDTKHDAKARRLAYELLVKADAKAPERLLPNVLQDPSLELRRDAVAVVLKEAEAALAKPDKDAAKAAFQRALVSARDKDQVDAIAKQLKTLGAEVDLAKHFGFIRQWQLLGPFDSTGGVGFAKVYPPEQGVVLDKEHAGKKDAKLQWKTHVTADPYAVVDLNKAISKHMGAAAYAYAVVESPTERLVEVRAGSNNAVKIWLNGKQLVAHEEYHHGNRMDQYVGVGTLRAGKNELLIKVCQNEQKEEWAQTWGFQVRLCDRVGTAVPVTVVEPKPAAEPTKGETQQ